MYLQKINLKNKYALVTGAGKGLGRACSIALAEAGATVIALSRTPSDLNQLEKDIKKVKREWVFGIYNIYNRDNATSILFRENTETLKNEAVQISIFGIVPSITYNFKF